ncbi:MAG: winged helix-turn-helix domain-containing protein [Rhodobacteraceae bacterium]|nr:winged helix-turn-helix domain-containing protein [Paracoccaceae bacterium]
MEFVFDAFRIDTDRFELSGTGGRIAVEPQALELLIHLIRNRHRLVTRDELHQTFWEGRFVSDSALSSLVRAAREAVGDSGREQRIIETEHGRGFRFRAAVHEAAAPAAEPARPAPPAAPAIAVLPFDNFSGNAGNDLIADGIVEEITAGLARFRWFTVIARNSAFAQRGRPADARRTGAELGADYLIEGSVNREGDRVRVHVQLIDATTGGHRWSGRFDLRFDGLFSLLDRITSQVVGALQPELLDSERGRAERTAPAERTAWQLFVEAQDLLMLPGREANARARALLGQAEAREPGAARVHASIALSHFWDIAYLWTDDRAASIAAAHAAARRAVALGPTDSWAWTALGAAKLFLRDPAGAIADMQRAVALDPHSALAHGALALGHGIAGDPEAALAAAATARRLSPDDPREPIWLNGESMGHFALGHFGEALAAARRLVERRPEYPTGHILVAASAAALGMDGVARTAVARLRDLQPGLRLEHACASVPFGDPALSALCLRGLARAGLPGAMPGAGAA